MPLYISLYSQCCAQFHSLTLPLCCLPLFCWRISNADCMTYSTKRERKSPRMREWAAAAAAEAVWGSQNWARECTGAGDDGADLQRSNEERSPWRSCEEFRTNSSWRLEFGREFQCGRLKTAVFPSAALIAFLKTCSSQPSGTKPNYLIVWA